jgi:hypothetical protein
MSYTPLDSDFLTSSLLQEGPDAVAVWALVLAAADKLGRSSMQPSAAASLLRIENERAEAAFALFCRPDLRSRNKEFEGRRLVPAEDGQWTIVSHQKYQHRASRSAATRRNREYEARVRERERAADVAENRCEHPGCDAPPAGAVAGRLVCTVHAFGIPEREPGQDG